jgi:hypothetical protein
MNTQRLLVVLTVVNLFLLLAALGPVRAAVDDGVAPVLRGRALQIVDAQGRVRASLGVLPAEAQPNGEISAETVLLRLITERGRPSVKIGASERSAGLSLAGPTNSRDTYIVIEASGTASSMRMRNEDGREQIIKP